MSIICNWIIVFFVFWAISGYGSIANILSSMSALVLLGLFFLNKKNMCFNMSNNLDKACISFVLFFIFYFITSILNTTDFIYWVGNIILYMFVSFFSLFITRYINMQWNLNKIKKIFRLVSLIWIGLVLSSVMYYVSHPGAARDAIVYQSQFDNLFIGGGYYLAYGSCILSIFVFGLLKNKFFEEKKYEELALGFIFLSTLHVLLTNSTLTLIWLFIGYALVLMFGRKTTESNCKHRKRIVGFSIIALVCCFIIFRNQIGSFVISYGNYESDSLYSRRIYELGTVIKGDTYTRHTNDRLSRPLMSWKLFCDSPIIGIGYRHGYTFKLMQADGLGNHSEIIDSLAKYGIFGFVLLFRVFYYFIRAIRKCLLPNGNNVWWLIMVGMMFFNPFVSMPSLVAVFLVIPMMVIITKGAKLE